MEEEKVAVHDDTAADSDSDVECFEDVEAENISSKTRKQYLRNMNLFILFLCEQNRDTNAFFVPGVLTVDNLKLPVDESDFKKFINSLARMKDESSGLILTTPLSTLTKFSSALKKLHEERDIPFPSSLAKRMKNYFRSIKKRIQQEKHKGLRDLLDGKSKLSWSAYRMLCNTLLNVPSRHQPETVHLFFILAWNLIARSDTVSGIMLSHISWVNDCLVITVCKHKGDTAGDSKHNMGKHVYANPGDPVVCPILWLAVYLCTHEIWEADGTTGGQFKNAPIFPGNHQGRRMGKRLSKLINDIMEDDTISPIAKALLVALGIHSFRKGMTVYSPPIHTQTHTQTQAHRRIALGAQPDHRQSLCT